MLNIIKCAEPSCFTYHRCQHNADYNNIPQSTRETLQKQILEEQGYLCAYCMQRISTIADMKIEHVLSQDEHPERQLDYSNLIGCCQGGEGKPRSVQHCDTHKGKYSLSKNPAHPGTDKVQESIYYNPDGQIFSTNSLLNKEIDTILHLNLPELCNNRKRIFKVVRGELSKLSQNASKAHIRKLIQNWTNKNADGQLKPLAGVAIYLLNKRLEKAR